MARTHVMLLLSLLLPAGTAAAQEERPVERSAESAAATGPLVACERVFARQDKFDRPLLVAFAPALPGTAFVVEQAGRISAVPCDEAATRRVTFLDLADRVYATGHQEEGLLGFAFDPEFAANGLCYACYTERTELLTAELRPGRKYRSSRQSVVARFATTRDKDGNLLADVASELRLLAVAQPFGNHNGGTIVFGPDGMLYVALGDGGAQRDPLGTAQDKGVLFGKVLRIDVRGAVAERPYRVPADNPFVGEAGARAEVWCYGLRNPWRIAFDRATGDLWCGDVGQDRREEVDRLVKGGNYGWSLMEGTEVFRKNAPRPPDLVAPIADYPHAEGLSVTGGHVYRGTAIPALVGSYVYGDYATFRLWAVTEDRQGGRHVVREIGRGPSQLSSFAEQPDGELLVTCFDGRIYRLVPAPHGG